MEKYYCKYCGQAFTNVRTLTFGKCQRHPDGCNKGNHALYEGREKAQYVCKYCGMKFSSLRSLTFAKCQRHPDGCNKGCHSPAL